ncbi:MAG TPA: diguanylate cyclase [Candidatus Polarisedimenticolaceae bacterium]|nr:diguanylate cyclase [Candidatus Polarisedimenticolaceae bacterium]
MRHEARQDGAREARGAVRGGDGGAFLIDGHGTIVGFDGGMERLTGWTAADVVGRVAGAPILVDGVASIPSAVADTTEIALMARDGSVLDVEAAVVRESGLGNRYTVSILRVVARSDAGRLAPFAGCDALTGLASRESFLERLDVEMRAAASGGRPLALVLADVDHLRKVADTRGRDAAASVLRKLAGILRAGVREEDLVARIAEDDFAVILNGLGRGSARQVAARLRSTVERFRFTATWDDTSSFGVTMSLGAASYPTDAESAADLVSRAQEALDEARSLGRNRVWCYTRRPRVPLRTPVYLDGAAPLLLGYTQDLSPSGLFVATSAPIDVGMRCALSFPLPTAQGNVHVIGRVVRTVPLAVAAPAPTRSAGMGVEFERFGPEDRRAIDAYLYESEARTPLPDSDAFAS